MNAYENTDKEIWRKIEGEYYSPRIFVTEEGSIGINVGGYVYVQSVEEWHKQADRIAELERQNEALEQLRPYWAKGFSDDSVAAQCTLSAMSELHKLLGVDNQTDAVIKIKQQADRIAELEKDLHMIQRHYDQLDTQLHQQTKPHPKCDEACMYLCTAKPLSDEEIEECYWGDGYPDNPRHPKEFAYAILRKAQEK